MGLSDKERIEQLEETIRKFLKPVRDIPFSIAIKALSGYDVIPFDRDDPRNKELLEKISKAAHLTGELARKQGIKANRPNEAGNRIEPFVLKALIDVGLKADRPPARSGRVQEVGYPDLRVIDTFGRTTYIDRKTYGQGQKNTSLRAFYMSPARQPKVNQEARHLLLSFELEEGPGRQRVYLPRSWQIWTFEKVLVSVKHEFNASNRDLYKNENLLCQGFIA